MATTRTLVGAPRASGGVTIAVAMGLMNVSTYAFTLVAARLLGPESYGAFSAVLGVLLVISVAQLGLQATAARRISAAPERADLVAPTVLGLTYRTGVVLGAVLLLLSPVLDRALKLDSLPTAALIGVCAVPITVMGGQAGVLQGERRWGALALVYLASGLPRLVLGVALLLWRPSEALAVLAVTLGFVAAVGVGTWAVRHHRGAVGSWSRAPGAGVRRTLVEAVHNSHALLAFFALTNVDIVLARNVLDADRAGLYAAGLIMVKTVLFLPQFVVVLAFPAMASDPRRRRALMLSTGVVVAVGAAVVLGSWLLHDLALTFVGGADYAPIGPDLWRWAVLGTMASTLQLLVYGVVARQSRWTVALLWAGLAAVIVGAGTVHGVVGLVSVVTVVDAVLVVALLTVSLHGTRASTQAASGPLPAV